MKLAQTLLAVSLLSMSPAIGDELSTALDDYVRRVVEDWAVPGLAIAVVKDGETVFAEGYGVLEIGKGASVDADTLFAIGSTTKAMTAAILGSQVDEGAITWDDRVTELLPGFRLHDPWVTREATVRDLLTHRAGLGNADLLWYGSDRSREEILRRLALVEPAYSMRDGFVYQNIMYIAAGELSAAVAGSTWEELMTGRLFEPLGMTRTRPTLGAAEPLPNVARPHDEVDDRVVAIENASVDSAGPAGSVWSSVNDMAKWMRMLLAEGELDGRRVLSAGVVDELFTPQALLDLTVFYPAVRLIEPHWTTYGLGWFQLDYEGRMVQFHTGSIDGMAAIVGLVPEEDLGVVVLENRDHAECRHALLWKVIDMWGGTTDGRDWSQELHALYAETAQQADAAIEAQRATRVAGTQPSLPLERYAGTYRNEIYADATVTFDGTELRVEVARDLAGSLAHWHYDTFEIDFDRPWQGEAPVTFDLGADGEPKRLRAMGLTWEKVPEEPAAN